MPTSLAVLPRATDDEEAADEISDCLAHCAKLAIDPMESPEQRIGEVAFGGQLVIAAIPGTGSYSLQAYGFRGVVRDV